MHNVSTEYAIKFYETMYSFFFSLSTQYVPVTSKLTVCILEAKDLPKTKKDNDKEEESNVEPTIDPMVKVKSSLEL